MKWPWIQAMMLMTALGVTQHTEQGRALQNAVINTAKSTIATYELNLLARQLDADRVNGPPPTPQRFPDFIRDVMSSRDPNRDVTLDPWDRAYWMQRESDRLMLRSDGPDGQRMTRDDLVVVVDLST